MHRWEDVTEREWPDLYAEWLKDCRSPREVALRAGELFDERGPKMPRRLRADLAEFLRERSEVDLARLVAMNDDPRDDRDFMAWLREGGQ